jgi:hypothetical protein
MTGDVARGVALLADLYIDTEDPTYIYNQGRCYEQNSRCAEAIDRFREYLRKATKAKAEDRADAERHMVECEALIDKKQPKPLLPPLPEPAPSLPVPSPAAAVPPVLAPQSAHRLLPRHQRLRHQRPRLRLLLRPLTKSPQWRRLQPVPNRALAYAWLESSPCRSALPR